MGADHGACVEPAPDSQTRGACAEPAPDSELTVGHVGGGWGSLTHLQPLSWFAHCPGREAGDRSPGVRPKQGDGRSREPTCCPFALGENGKQRQPGERRGPPAPRCGPLWDFVLWGCQGRGAFLRPRAPASGESRSEQTGRGSAPRPFLWPPAGRRPRPLLPSPGQGAYGARSLGPRLQNPDSKSIFCFSPPPPPWRRESELGEARLSQNRPQPQASRGFVRGALPSHPCSCSCVPCRYIRCQKEVGKSFERHKLKRQDPDAW